MSTIKQINLGAVKIRSKLAPLFNFQLCLLASMCLITGWSSHWLQVKGKDGSEDVWDSVAHERERRGAGSLFPINRGQGIPILLPNDTKLYIGEKAPDRSEQLCGRYPQVWSSQLAIWDKLWRQNPWLKLDVRKWTCLGTRLQKPRGHSRPWSSWSSYFAGNR